MKCNPLEPGTIMVTQLTHTSIAVTWDEIAGITDYIVTLTVANGTQLFSDIIRGTRMANFTGLLPGREYTVRVGLQCADDVLMLRKYTVPLQPICATFAYVEEESVTVQWRRPAGDLTGYRITFSDGSGSPRTELVYDSESLDLELPLTGLTDGPSVVVNISTIAGVGLSQSESNEVSISPSSLGSLFNITSLTNSSVAFGWADLSDGAEYEVCIQPAGGNRSCLNVTERYAEFTGLVAGATYTLSVGWGSECDISLTLNTVPNDPIDLQLTNATSCAAEIMWGIPEGVYNYFEVTYTPSDGVNRSPERIYSANLGDNATTVMHRFEGLSPDEEYNVTVTIVTGADDVRGNPVDISFRTVFRQESQIREV
ncbi:tenascin-R-like [Diadema antillarum]|uniref:tenascin-R-like n=1 Tax=Diadema antillarum TaxID=105358 RepID=UPI003A86F051